MSNLIVITDLRENEQGIFEFVAAIPLENQNMCK